MVSSPLPGALSQMPLAYPSVCFHRYNPFLMACYNPESEEFQSVCSVMSGFSDDFYKEVYLNCYFV